MTDNVAPVMSGCINQQQEKEKETCPSRHSVLIVVKYSHERRNGAVELFRNYFKILQVPKNSIPGSRERQIQYITNLWLNTTKGR